MEYKFENIFLISLKPYTKSQIQITEIPKEKILLNLLPRNKRSSFLGGNKITRIFMAVLNLMHTCQKLHRDN